MLGKKGWGGKEEEMGREGSCISQIRAGGKAIRRSQWCSRALRVYRTSDVAVGETIMSRTGSSNGGFLWVDGMVKGEDGRMNMYVSIYS